MNPITTIAKNAPEVNTDNTVEKYDFDPLPVKPENIPNELKDHPYWCAWKLVYNPEDLSKKPKKVPVNPITRCNLGSDSTKGWVDFETALSAYKNKYVYAGIGMLLTEDDPFVGIDIDNCMNDDSPNASVADDILETLNSYSEISPSATGFRVFCKRGKKPLSLEGNKTDSAEIYWSKRFLTVTGWVSDEDMVKPVRRCSKRLKKVHEKYIVNEKSAPPAKQATSIKQVDNQGSTGFGDTTLSGQDFALCCKYLKQGKTTEKVKQLLISKGCNHEKYKRPDYINRTVRAAFEKVSGARCADAKPVKNSNTTVFESAEDPANWLSMPSINHAAVAKADVPEPEWLIKDWIRHDTYIGQLVGEQQTGKSYLLTVLSYCLACGRSFGQFEIPEPRRVAYINVEDPKDQIDFRCKQVLLAMEFTADEQALIEQNLKIFPWIGRFGSINKPDPDSTEIKLLNNMITDFKPNLVIGDTKSRLTHGDENNNSIQTGLVRILEGLAVQYGGVFLMAHHPTKSNPKSSRGAGSWESNLRLTINLVKMDGATGQRFGFTAQEAKDRAFVMTCNDNYGGKNTAYFYKDEKTGMPRPIAKGVYAAEVVQEWLLESLKKLGEVNKRALLQTSTKEDTTVKAMLESFPDIRGGKKTAIKDAVDALLEDDQIYEIKQGKTTILTTKRPAPKFGKSKKEKKSQ